MRQKLRIIGNKHRSLINSPSRKNNIRVKTTVSTLKLTSQYNISSSSSSTQIMNAIPYHHGVFQPNVDTRQRPMIHTRDNNKPISSNMHPATLPGANL